MPVVRDPMTTFSWAREMSRHRGRLVAVQFRISDGESVLVGHYSEPATELTAAEAVGIVDQLGDPRGFQVVIPRSISAREVVHVRSAPQLGWRFSPTAKGRNFTACPCPVCRTRGDVGEARIRRSIIESRLAPPNAPAIGQVDGFASAASVAAELGERQAARRSYRRIEDYTGHDDPTVRARAFAELVQLASMLGPTSGFDPERELERLTARLDDEPDPRVRGPAAAALAEEIAFRSALLDDEE